MTERSSAPAHYRADIDGLRAIAVLAVLGFHAEFSPFGGGFVGVDVFFVISGYLISGIIIDALSADSFSYADFYTRRINRIFPALITVVAAALLIGWAILFPPEFESLGKHVIGGSTFVSNFVLWKEAGYFDSSAKPLLHLWSLAVEEQFYLVWPILLLIGWKRRWNLTALVSAILAASFAASVWAIGHSAGHAAFYLPLTRFWEIAAGALLCLISVRRPAFLRRMSFGPSARNILSFSGLLLLLAALAVIDRNTPWPGWITLLPIIGTLLLIASGSESLASRWVLSRRALVGIGLISYPLYLWHWPLFVFARLVHEGQLTSRASLGIIALSMILAFGTFRLIEAPIRFGFQKRRSARRLGIAMAGLGAVGCLVYWQLVPARLSSEYKKIAVVDHASFPPGGYFDNAGSAMASITAGDSTRTVAVIGDSHGIQYRPRFDELAKRNLGHFPKVMFFTYGGCPPLPGVNREGISWDGSRFRCDDFNRQVMNQLMSPRVKVILVAAFWQGYFAELNVFRVTDASKKRLLPGSQAGDSIFLEFEKEVKELRTRGKQVYLVLSSPNSPSNNPNSMLPRRLPGLAEKKITTEVPRGPMQANTLWIDSHLRAIGKATGAIIIDPMQFLCNESTCPTVDELGPIYTDNHHLRPFFVRWKVTFLDVVTAQP